MPSSALDSSPTNAPAIETASLEAPRLDAVSFASTSSDAPVDAPRDRFGPLGLAVFNAFFWPYLLGSCVAFFFVSSTLFVLTAPFDRRRRCLQAFTTWWGMHYLAWAPFAGIRVVGGERFNPGQGCIYVSNHQSMVDILAVYAIRRPFLWVSKVENFYVPFLGWNMWLNRYIPLKRGYLPSIMRMVRRCIRRLGEGESLFLFPEGTRSPNGQLQSFYSGAFRIAVRNRVPIVPIVIQGSNHVLPKGSFRVSPQPVTIEILPPVTPQSVDGDWRRLQDVVRARMIESQRRLRTVVVSPAE